jgi:hypothetical protein
MLHYEYGIGRVAEFAERLYELPVVPLVQAYTRLIEYVGDT